MRERARLLLQKNVLRHSEFRAYWLGSVFSSYGTWLQTITGSIFMLQLTGSPFMVGLWNFASFAPMFLFTPVGGVLGDRWDRKAIVSVTHIASAALVALLATATFLGRATPTLLLLMGFLVGCLYSISKPALSALFYPLVSESELATASAANTLGFNLGQLFGAATAAAMTAMYGPEWAFLLNALTFMGPVAAMQRITAVQVRETRATVGFAAMVEGFRFVGRRKVILRMLVSVALISSVTEAIRTLAPDFVQADLGRDESHGGTLVAFFGVGSVAGLLGFGRLQRLMGQYTARIGYAVLACGTLAIALAPTLLVSLVVAVPAGVGFAMVLPLLHGRIQLFCPEALRSRVMAAYAMALLGSRPLAALVAGSIASQASSRWALAGFSGLAAAGCAWSVLSLRRSNEISPQPDRS